MRDADQKNLKYFHCFFLVLYLNTFAVKKNKKQNSIVKLQHAPVLPGSVSVSPGDTRAPTWSSQIKNTFAKKGGERDFAGVQYFNWFAWSISVSVQVWQEKQKLPPCLPSTTGRADKLQLSSILSLWYINIKYCKCTYENTWLLSFFTGEFWGVRVSSGGSSMNNAKVLPAQTLQSQHYSFP